MRDELKERLEKEARKYWEKLEKLKGVSPLIAAVLLIMFTITVGGMLSQWAPNILQSSQRESSDTSEEIRSCAGLDLEILERTDSSVTFQQVAGEREAGNVSVIWFYSDWTITRNYTTIASVRESATVSSGFSGQLEELRIESLDCQGAPAATYP